MDDDLTPLQHTERDAMLLDRAAVLHVVDALRRYREAARRLLATRYGDGTCDGASVSSFSIDVDDIEGADRG